MKLHVFRLVLAATAAAGVTASGLAACFDWSTPAVSSVEGGTPDTSTVETGALPDASDTDALPSCGPPITPPSVASLHLTLDDLASLSTPAAGSGVAYLTTATENNFAPGVCRDALRFEAGVYLSYPEVPQAEGGEAGVPNINYAEGTIMFWYLPDYAAGDVAAHALIQTFGGSGAGRVRVTSRQNYGGLDFDCFNGFGRSTVALAPRRWVHIALTWKDGVPPRLFLNGVLDTSPLTIDASVVPPPVPNPLRRIALGNVINQDAATGFPADGLIDDLRIFPVAIP